MKFGYMIDSPVYEPHFLEAPCLADAVELLQRKLDTGRMAQRTPDSPYVEIWEDKRVDRKHMSFEDLSGVYKLYPRETGVFVSHELCLDIWNELCKSSNHIDSHGNLVKDVAGFSKDKNLKEVFAWLDAHTGKDGVVSLVFGDAATIPAEPVFIPCSFVSLWDGFGTVYSDAKYDPINNRVYDIEVAELSEKELDECEILVAEYMELLGRKFNIHENDIDHSWHVEGVDPLYVLSELESMCPEIHKKDIYAALIKAAKEAEALGAELIVSPDDFHDDQHLDPVWYGGYLGTIVYKGLELAIQVHGEVDMYGETNDREEFSYHNKDNSGAMHHNADNSLRNAFKNDRDLWAAISNGDIQFDSNNWIEAFVVSEEGYEMNGHIDDGAETVLKSVCDVKRWVDFLEREYIQASLSSKIEHASKMAEANQPECAHSDIER